MLLSRGAHVLQQPLGKNEIVPGLQLSSLNAGQVISDVEAISWSWTFTQL